MWRKFNDSTMKKAIKEHPLATIAIKKMRICSKKAVYKRVYAVT